MYLPQGLAGLLQRLGRKPEIIEADEEPIEEGAEDKS
jgi:hypothetical protein